jgi:hypothetical protein
MLTLTAFELRRKEISEIINGQLLEVELMTFEGGFLLIFAFMFGVPLLFWLAKLVAWLTGNKIKPVRWVLAIVIVLPIAFSLYLDAGGAIKPAKVVDKQDTITLGKNGSWWRTLSIAVECEAPGESFPARFTLGCDAATFDRLRIGEMAEVRLLDYGQFFKFARLKNRSTFSLLAKLIPREPRGPWHQATAVVQEVTHITQYSARRSTGDLRWPYDIVQLSFVAEGVEPPILAVDLIEASSVPGLAKDSQVQITWPEDDPRSARILGARPGAPWKNYFYWMVESLALPVIILAGLVVWALIGHRRKRRRQVQAN